MEVRLAISKMDIASYAQVYPHQQIEGGSFLAIARTNLGYNILGTLCCVGLFILVMAAIVFAAFLYRRRRSTQLMAMNAALQQQPLAPSYDGEAPDLANEQLYQTDASNPNAATSTNFSNLVDDAGSGSSDDEP
jgi:hypothetical protein